MLVVGGITRLTESGLSMVDWKPVSRVLPPMNEAEWADEFEKYKAYPEFQIKNFDFTLQDYKQIFWWEYIHRLLGRVIGLVFIVPFLFFWIKGRLEPLLFRRLLVLLGLGGSLGVIGWLMVKSGLNTRPDVSHYMLALHLFMAFITFGYTFWLALTQAYANTFIGIRFKLVKRLLRILIFLTLLQVVYGAFVAGLNAGLFYNTFPKMGDRWVAEGVTALSPWYQNLTESIAGVQFIHRYLAVIITILVAVVIFKSFVNNVNILRKRAAVILGIAVIVQFTLGVLTLLFQVPIAMAALHQFGALLLFAATVYTLFLYSK